MTGKALLSVVLCATSLKAMDFMSLYLMRFNHNKCMYQLYCTTAPSYAQAHDRVEVPTASYRNHVSSAPKNKMKPSPPFSNRQQN